MKATILVLSSLVFLSLASFGQVAPGGNQRVNTLPTANNPGSAEYAAVSVAPRAGGANNQGSVRGAFGQQGQGRRGAEYVSVSIAPRRR